MDGVGKEMIQKGASYDVPCFILCLYRRVFRVAIFAGGVRLVSWHVLGGICLYWREEERGISGATIIRTGYFLAYLFLAVRCHRFGIAVKFSC